MNTSLSVGELAEPAITSYLAYLTRKGRVEKICFFLAQYVAEYCPISKSLGNITRLLADI